MAPTKATGLSSRIVALNGHELVVMLNRMDLMKYSTIDHKWTRLLRAPHRAHEFSMVMNQETNRLYMLMGCSGTARQSECMKVLDVSTGSIVQRYELQYHHDTGIFRGFQLVNVNGTIHRIGRSLNLHAIWNEVDAIWNEREDKPDTYDNSIGGQLIYVNSKNVILMFGGIFYEENGNKCSVGIWRFQVATWK